MKTYEYILIFANANRLSEVSARRKSYRKTLDDATFFDSNGRSFEPGALPCTEIAVELAEARMRHPDAMDDFLVLHGDVVERGIDGAGGAGRVRKVDGDSDGALDACGEICAVEVGGVLLRGGLGFGGRLALDDARPAALALLQVAHRIRDGGNVEDGTCEMVV